MIRKKIKILESVSDQDGITPKLVQNIMTKSWLLGKLSGKVPGEKKKPTFSPISKKGSKRDPGTTDQFRLPAYLAISGVNHRFMTDNHALQITSLHGAGNKQQIMAKKWMYVAYLNHIHGAGNIQETTAKK
jgi:hypothetical protein